jgi:BirA family transcriptional regulator, biotin operon repressor / biotin---[acetyl-CoA-carboxylase] ligase
LVETRIGSAHLYYLTLTSTNRFAHLLLSKTLPRAGTVIVAGFQSAGEGQFGRSWFGSKGTNLYLSVILYPQIPAAEQFRLSAFVALALRDTVAYFMDRQTFVKWPNDIYVEDRKIGGILIQNSISGQTIQQSVIGIGLNVNEQIFPETLPNPTSLMIETGHKCDIYSVMKKLVEYLNEWHERARNIPIKMLKNQYTNHLYNYGNDCLFHMTENNRTASARISGVDDTGRLLLKFSDVERVEAYTLNQIRQVVV